MACGCNCTTVNGSRPITPPNSNPHKFAIIATGASKDSRKSPSAVRLQLGAHGQTKNYKAKAKTYLILSTRQVQNRNNCALWNHHPIKAVSEQMCRVRTCDTTKQNKILQQHGGKIVTCQGTPYLHGPVEQEDWDARDVYPQLDDETRSLSDTYWYNQNAQFSLIRARHDHLANQSSL